MKKQFLIAFSAGLNVTLAGAIFLSAKRTSPPLKPLAVAPPIAVSLPPAPAPAENPALSEPPFRWDQIESEDPKVYRDNLRSIGCPDLTVQEIMRAVINNLFGPHRHAILASFQDQYWNFVLHGQQIKRQWVPQSEWGRQLTALSAEREKMIEDVLGHKPSGDDKQMLRASLEQHLAWLSPHKRDHLIELEEQHQENLKEWTDSLGSRVNEPRTAEDEARLQKLNQDFDQAEKQLLTPEELAEYRLSQSNVAGWAASLPDFNPNEEQWRTLTELRAQYEETLASTSLTNNDPAQQNQLQENFDDAVKGALDPDTYAQYQLANNDQYQALQNVTQRYGLPDSAATQSLDVEQAAQAQAAQIRANSNLSSEDQQAALNSLQQQTEQNLTQILGPDVLSTYKEYSGDWISSMARPRQK
jgi:hypothetical protein